MQDQELDRDVVDHEVEASPPATGALRLGAVAWILAIQFFVVQVIAQMAWTAPFSLKENYISDLGNTTCGPFLVGEHVLYVCSPLHAWMNASFIVLGLLVLAGVVLLRPAFPPGSAAEIGLALVACAGPGLALVGMFPEDVNLLIHKAGAALHLILGNLGMVVVGYALATESARRTLAVFSIVAGVACLLATGLFAAGVYLGLGIGGMERVAVYPLPIWMMVVGATMFQSPRPGDASEETD